MVHSPSISMVAEQGACWFGVGGRGCHDVEAEREVFFSMFVVCEPQQSRESMSRSNPWKPLKAWNPCESHHIPQHPSEFVLLSSIIQLFRGAAEYWALASGGPNANIGESYLLRAGAVSKPARTTLLAARQQPASSQRATSNQQENVIVIKNL